MSRLGKAHDASIHSTTLNHPCIGVRNPWAVLFGALSSRSSIYKSGNGNLQSSHVGKMFADSVLTEGKIQRGSGSRNWSRCPDAGHGHCIPSCLNVNECLSRLQSLTLRFYYLQDVPRAAAPLQNIVRFFETRWPRHPTVHEHAVVFSNSELRVIHVCMLKG